MQSRKPTQVRPEPTSGSIMKRHCAAASSPAPTLSTGRCSPPPVLSLLSPGAAVSSNQNGIHRLLQPEAASSLLAALAHLACVAARARHRRRLLRGVGAALHPVSSLRGGSRRCFLVAPLQYASRRSLRHLGYRTIASSRFLVSDRAAFCTASAATAAACLRDAALRCLDTA